MLRFSWRWFVFGVLLILVDAHAAGAHALGLKCTIQGDRVHVETFYDDDTTARDALVVILDAAKETIATGKTDAKGMWSFARPPDGVYRVIVDAGGGHRLARRLRVGETGPQTEDTVFEEGDDRDEFTRFPWLKLAIGIGIIAALSIAFLLARRSGRHDPRRSLPANPDHT